MPTANDVIIIFGGMMCGMAFQQNIMFIIGIMGMVLIAYGFGNRGAP